MEFGTKGEEYANDIWQASRVTVSDNCLLDEVIWYIFIL